MPDFTFTADSTTDQLTITAHGLLTGAGPAGIYNFDGVLPTGTPSINSVAHYWIIAVDANHVKLAVSSADAFAGTAIDITANGSGTHRLYLGLPTRRNRTYTAGSQVSSIDLNAFSDGFELGRRAPFGRRFFPRLAYPGTTNPFVYFFQTGSPGVASSGACSDAYLEIPYIPGERILGLHMWNFGDGAADITFSMEYQPAPGGSLTTLSTLSDVNRAGVVYSKVIMPTFTSQILAEDSVLKFKLNVTAATYIVGPCTAWFDKLN